MSKACNDSWNNKKGRSFLQVSMFPSVSGFKKISYLTIWKALYETRLMFQHVLCVVLFHAENQLWMVLLRYLFMEMYLLHIKEEKKSHEVPSLLFLSFWWKPIREQEFSETIKMSKHRNLLNQGNCTSPTLYYFFFFGWWQLKFHGMFSYKVKTDNLSQMPFDGYLNSPCAAPIFKEICLCTRLEIDK